MTIETSKSLRIEWRNIGANVETAQGSAVKVVTVLKIVGRHYTCDAVAM